MFSDCDSTSLLNQLPKIIITVRHCANECAQPQPQPQSDPGHFEVTQLAAVAFVGNSSKSMKSKNAHIHEFN